MPSQHIGAFLTEKEKDTVDETCERLGITRYRLFKNALKEYCESRLKEGTEHDGRKTEGNPEREPEGARSSESIGGNAKTDNQRGDQAGPTAEPSSDLEDYLRYLRVAT